MLVQWLKMFLMAWTSPSFHLFHSTPILFSLPYPLSLAQLSSAAPGRVELESRLHELTESLIQKQTTLEALSSEKSSLNVQLQRMKVGYTPSWCWNLVQCLVLSFVRKVQHTIKQNHNLNFLVVTGLCDWTLLADVEVLSSGLCSVLGVHNVWFLLIKHTTT